MARLICTGIVSLDGYINDSAGAFDWSTPDDEVHAFVNELERPIGTYLYGRRLYDVMKVWEDVPSMPDQPELMLEYAAIWRAADKIVYSRSLRDVPTPRTRVERDFDPAAVAQLKKDSPRDISIGGPTLAAPAISAGLVDEYQLLVSPVLVGGGTRFFPDGIRLDLELDLTENTRFGNGVVFLRYRPRKTDTE